MQSADPVSAQMTAPGQQLPGGLQTDPFHRQFRQPGLGERVRRSWPNGRQYHDLVGHQPAGGEGQRFRRRLVQQMRVVHQDRQRMIFGEPAEQAQRSGADGEPVPAVAVPQSERDPQ
jgi:hypothetical protein